MKTIISEIVEILLGYQSRSSILEMKNGSHTLIQARDLKMDCEISWEKLIQFYPDPNIAKNEIKQNDILFLSRGSNNFAYKIDQFKPLTLVSNSIYILRCSKKAILPDFIVWWLNQPLVQKRFELLRSGTIMPYITVKSLRDTEIVIPPVTDQQIIVNVASLQKREETLVRQLSDKRTTLINAILEKKKNNPEEKYHGN